MKDFTIGDHVSVIFDLNNMTGHEDKLPCALGGDAAGVLRKYAIYQDKHLVQLPKYMPWEEVRHSVPKSLLFDQLLLTRH